MKLVTKTIEFSFPYHMKSNSKTDLGWDINDADYTTLVYTVHRSNLAPQRSPFSHWFTSLFFSYVGEIMLTISMLGTPFPHDSR